MIAVPKTRRRCRPTPQWHAMFLKMLPLIDRIARYGVRDVVGGDFDDAVQEIVANALVAYVQLVTQGRAEDACASSLARYAVGQYWAGRRVGAKLNIRDVMSVHCRRNKGVRIESLHHWDGQELEWQEALIEDKRVTPADLAASRIDFPDWLESLEPRDRKIAETLAKGETTLGVAKRFGISAARISQLRRKLMESWRAFHEPDAPELALV